MNKFKKVVILDTVIFYPEHEVILKELVEKPKIERVPLEFNQDTNQWELPTDYVMPEDSNIIVWPASLPESFEGISIEIHNKLKTGLCWVEEGLVGDLWAQNLLNRINDADCIITCWTGIPDNVLDMINPKAILTWTHEYEHRLNVTKANEKGIYTGCVEDYGTDAVAELEFNMLLELIDRNKKTTKKFETDEDIAIGVLTQFFKYYRKADANEKNTRKGKFSHQFHKIGRSLKYYGDLSEKKLDDIIPSKLIEGKNIGILSNENNLDYLENILQKGFKSNVHRLRSLNSNVSDFYKTLSLNDFVIYDSSLIDETTKEKIVTIKNDMCIDIQSLLHYEETIKGKVLGIIGLGRIGNRVAEIADSFGVKVFYSGNKKGVKHENIELDVLLKQSDIVSLNVKAHKVENLISKEKIEIMKNGVYFINTSDGNALDQKELTRRMLENSLYVGMDVYQGLPTTRTLCLDENFSGKLKEQLGNHVLTYRAGWSTQESIKVKTHKLLGHMITALTK
jgi:lactate dehydrogenase-like 2-hydroxyacid dehydrogenase